MLNPDNDIKIIYTTPETASSDFKENLHILAEKNKLKRFVIDEAHCISLEGNDFRPQYKELQEIRTNFPEIPIGFNRNCNKSGFKGFCIYQGLNEPKIYTKSYFRSNLNIIVKR